MSLLKQNALPLIREYRSCGWMVCALLLATPVMSIADERSDHAHETRHDHEQARQALQAGEIMPLTDVLARVAREYPGAIIDVELDKDRNRNPDRSLQLEPPRLRWIYKIKVLLSGGTLAKVRVDAHDGTLLSAKTRSPDRH
jgi:uncharacterized membrane protein YkoI